MRGSVWIGLLILLVFTNHQACAQVSIPVVHTWADLENAPKITVMPSPRVEKGEAPPMVSPVIFQVGIENNEVASYSGTLLYFIAPDSAEADATPGERGLYLVEIDGSTPPLRQFQGGFNGRTVQKKTPTNGTTFYAETIPFQAAGDYVVKLLKAPDSWTGFDPRTDHQVLAQTTIHVQDRAQELWFPFGTTEDISDGASWGRNADRSFFAIVPVSNPKGCSVIPKAYWPQTYVQLPIPGQPLPSLFPNDVDQPKVQLKMVDATLIATFDPKIESFFPEGNFVTRWWVNGASVDFDPALEKPIESKCLAASVIIAEKLPFEVMAPVAPYYREVHFAINFLPERFGDLKKGDQVSVQMLFCLSGFGETNGLEDSFRFHDTSDSPPSSFSEISNRIDFTYSGDPQHPQQ